MKKTVMLFACVFTTLSMTTQAAFPSDAKLSLNKNNIKVWTYKDANSSVLSYRAETTFDAPIEKAVALVLDVNNTPKWVPNVSKAEVLYRDDKKGDFTIYMVLDLPFPLKDRDMIVKGNMSKDTNGLISIRNTAIQQGKSINPNYIRLKEYTGDWTFQRLGANKVKVTTSGHANPEGAIPISVTNLLVEQQPYQMLQKMKVELAKNKKYPAIPEILK